MIRHCVAWCSRHSGFVIVAALFLGLGGELARRGLSRDAVPDLSDPQVVRVGRISTVALLLVALPTELLTTTEKRAPLSAIVSAGVV